MKTFVDATKAAGLHADIGLIAAWDPGIITVAALKKYGFGLTTAQMKDFIDTLHGFPGVYGIYDFRDGSQRGLAPSNGIVVKWDPARDYWTPVSKIRRHALTWDDSRARLRSSPAVRADSGRPTRARSRPKVHRSYSAISPTRPHSRRS